MEENIQNRVAADRRPASVHGFPNERHERPEEHFDSDQEGYGSEPLHHRQPLGPRLPHRARNPERWPPFSPEPTNSQLKSPAGNRTPRLGHVEVNTAARTRRYRFDPRPLVAGTTHKLRTAPSDQPATNFER